MNWQTLRRLLDRLYLAAGVIASLFLLIMLALIVLQMVARWTGTTFRGAPDYAGYCMAAASFFAFAHALNAGAHIRVSMLLNALGSHGHWLDVWCFLIGSVASTYLAWYAVRAVQWSYKFHDISQGQDATPLWIPQLSMALGSVLLAICFWDNLVRLLATRKHNIVTDSVLH
jgi:TRAP-type C4-dicarboxylate transport system permease small subunit